MRLSDALSLSRITLDMKAGTKSSALEELLRLAAECLDLGDTGALRQRVLDREAICSTAVNGGVGIPHARSPEIDGVVASLGISRTGLDFDSPDGEPVRLVFLILSSEIATPAYLSVLGRTARIFRREEMRERILKAETPDAIIQSIASQEPA